MRTDPAAQRLLATSRFVTRYGLVLVLAWIGGGKFVKMDSRVLVEQSPLMSGLYELLGGRAFASALGTVEIIAALLIALRPAAPRLSAAGGAAAVLLFLGTISLLLTSRGVVVEVVHGFPVLSAQPGQFLLKDVVLLGAALWVLGDSLRAMHADRVVSGSVRSSA